MKKDILVISLFMALFLTVGLIAGCGGTGSSSTTTTTLSDSATAAETAQSAVKAAVGVAQTSQSTGNMADTAPSASGILSVKTYSDPTPPDAFFATLPADGWITIEASAFATGETVQIRMYTTGGERIDSTFLATKKIASIESYDWDDMVSNFNFTTFASKANAWLNYDTDWDPADTSKMASFYGSSTKYKACTSLWEYIIFAYITPQMENILDYAYKLENLTPTGLSTYPSITTPEATSNDGLGTQEAHITGTHADGSTIDITQGVSTDATGKPVSATGSGTITRADGVVMTINSMTMTFSDGAPSSGTMDITVGSPDNMHMEMTMTATGAATGTVYSTATDPETEIGTIVMFASTDAYGHDGYFLPVGLDDVAANREYF